MISSIQLMAMLLGLGELILMGLKPVHALISKHSRTGQPAMILFIVQSEILRNSKSKLPELGKVKRFGHVHQIESAEGGHT